MKATNTMQFRTIVDVEKPPFSIEPLEPMLFVGSCFAQNIGARFAEERFPVVVNPYGVMYNPASVLHTVQRCDMSPRITFITLGTNHVYRLKQDGQIVDNCQKRPHNLFTEEQLTIDQCAEYIGQAIDILRQRNSDARVVVTVSPIRYAKYGFHESQLSKAVLLLAVRQVCEQHACACYFPAYEIVLDELRDYRFYQPDMIHPSQQAVDYLWQQLVEHYFSERAKRFLEDWRPIKEALGHRPFDPDSKQYADFIAKTREKEAQLLSRYQSGAV